MVTKKVILFLQAPAPRWPNHARILFFKATFKGQPGYALRQGPKGKKRWLREEEETLPAFIRSSTVQQAEQEALKLGVKSVDYRQSLDIANQVNAALEDLKQRGFTMPDHTRVDDQFFLRWAQQLGATPDEFPAAFVNSRQTGETYLFANPLYRYWNQLAQDALQQYQRGEWSTAPEHHAIRHEIGHLLFYRANPARYAAMRTQPLTGGDLQIAHKVSLYAGTSAIEFIAETFALLVDGKTLPADVLRLYNQLGGIYP